jgi:hypothetical protein
MPSFAPQHFPIAFPQRPTIAVELDEAPPLQHHRAVHESFDNIKVVRRKQHDPLLSLKRA